jgi:hypothetical protein
MEKLIIDLLETIIIPKEYQDWAEDLLKESIQSDIEENKLIKNNLKRTIVKQKADLERILGLCVR